MNNHYRRRTPEQVEKKIDKLKVDHMVKTIMTPSQSSASGLLNRMIERILKRKRLYVPKPSEREKVRRLERKLKRMKEGKWRKGKE